MAVAAAAAAAAWRREGGDFAAVFPPLGRKSPLLQLRIFSLLSLLLLAKIPSPG